MPADMPSERREHPRNKRAATTTPNHWSAWDVDLDNTRVNVEDARRMATHGMRSNVMPAHCSGGGSPRVWR